MRHTIQTTNAYGGRDIAYKISCDICGAFLRVMDKKEKKMVDMEFKSCGEDWLSAQAAGWIGEYDCMICDKCLKSIGKE